MCLARRPTLFSITSVTNDHTWELFAAAVDATAETVLNSLCAARTTVGRGGNTVYELPLDRLTSVLRDAGRLAPA